MSNVDLRARRIEMGLTLPQFAKAAGVAYHVARRAERGERIREDSAKLITDLLGVRPRDLYPVEPKDVAA